MIGLIQGLIFTGGGINQPKLCKFWHGGFASGEKAVKTSIKKGFPPTSRKFPGPSRRELGWRKGADSEVLFWGVTLFLKAILTENKRGWHAHFVLGIHPSFGRTDVFTRTP